MSRMPKIVCLDGFTLNPGDLDWRPLHALGEFFAYERSAPHEVVPRADGAEIVLTNKTVLAREHFAQLPKLRYVGVLATGYNVVDLAAARDRKIPVTNVPSYGTRSVAQMVFAHVLNLTHRVGVHAEAVRAGRWTECPDFCFWDVPLVDLEGLTMGIVGFGRIGKATGALARAFGMRVLACRAASPSGERDGVHYVSLEELLRESDVVSLHCPLTPETKGLIHRERLALMKPTAFLINTSRGPLVDEAALAEALDVGKIAGAGLDVLSMEPPKADHPLLKAKNCFLTPHIAWATRAARARLLQAVADNLRAFLAGFPKNVVNGV
ncbi:MAG: D-2-hydroxyacid dehydrogenase [Verrucomicrobiae bacterium]|nr:D-2-hydroxyacid dehydrogenase [Verrucomicrobiae bacterium]